MGSVWFLSISTHYSHPDQPLHTILALRYLDQHERERIRTFTLGLDEPNSAFFYSDMNTSAKTCRGRVSSGNSQGRIGRARAIPQKTFWAHVGTGLKRCNQVRTCAPWNLGYDYVYYDYDYDYDYAYDGFSCMQQRVLIVVTIKAMALGATPTHIQTTAVHLTEMADEVLFR